MLPWTVACEGNWLRVRVIGPDRMGEVSRGHSSRRKRALTVAGRPHPDEGLNGAACRKAGVNESGE